MLVLLLDGVETLDLGRFGPALSLRDHGELFLGQPLKLGNVRFNDLVQIGGAERPVADAGEERVGPRLEQLLAVAGKLELALEFLMGNARAAEIGVRLTHAPIGKGGRTQGESE